MPVSPLVRDKTLNDTVNNRSSLMSIFTIARNFFRPVTVSVGSVPTQHETL
jgi:hypothetical protein